MRRLWASALAVPLVALLASAGAPAMAQDTPVGAMEAVGDAGSALALMRLLPGSVPADSIMPELAGHIPEDSALEAGFGLTSAQANSDATLNYERSVAQAAYGGATMSSAPTPGTLVQTALPDNPASTDGALAPQPSPLDDLVHTGAMTGTAHARWGAALGPCVNPIAGASTELARLALGNAVPTLPDVPFAELKLSKGRTLAKGFTPRQNLGTLGGLLAGSAADASEKGVLISAPGDFSSTSTMRLVDLPRTKKRAGQDTRNKAVRAISTVSTSEIRLLRGGPLELRAKVLRGPRLEATSTGTANTSKITYTRPVLDVRRGSERLFRLDAKRPSEDIPIGVPVTGFEKLPRSKNLAPGLVVGGAAVTRKGKAQSLSDEQLDKVVDLFVLRLGIGGLDQKAKDMAAPFEGHQLGASARLLDVQLMPTKALAAALGARGAKLPSALLQISLGEQVASAYAPTGGVACGKRVPTTPGQNGGQAEVPVGLQSSGAPFAAGPVLWTGALAVLAGVLLYAAAARRPRATPSPMRREQAV